MKIIGITGGVGAGKTQILEYLNNKYGVTICMADEVGKKLQKKGTECFDEIVAHFGEKILDEKIPKLTIQPLVENAVQHGIHDCMETGWIRMEIHRNGEMLDVTVSDNGAGMTEEMIARVMAGRADQNEEDRFSTGIAVRNVIDRLQLYYKEENLFTIESDGPGKGTRVHIILPVYKDELE